MADLKRWEIKALCMFGLFASMAIFVLIPIRVAKIVEKKGKRGQYIISLLSCFGGGTFFGAYLLHLSPEVREVLEESFLIPNNISYAVPEAMAGLGFFLILFLEKIILYCRDRSIKNSKSSTSANSYKTADPEKATKHTYEINVKLTGHSYDNNAMDKMDEGHNAIGRFYTTEENRSRSGSLAKKQSPDSMSMSSASSKDLVSDDDGAGKTRSIIFIIALSLDCIFEGLALGLMDKKVDVLNLFVAIISHEFIMSFCIGMELVKYNPIKKVVPAGLLYAFTPVIGAIIGTAIKESQQSVGNEQLIETVSGMLQAMSAGTFIYCSFIGILSEELTHDNHIWKALVTLLGFGVMAGMAAIPEDALGGSEEEIVTTAFPMITST